MPFRHELVIFDFDDTLIRSRADRFERLLSSIRNFGYDIEESALRAAWGRPFQEMVEKAVPEISSVFPDFLDFYVAALQEFAPQTQPGIEEVLNALSGELPIVVLSSSYSRLVEQDLTALGLLENFESIFGSDRTKFHKPDPRCLEEICVEYSSFASSRQNWVLVGDSCDDFNVAKENGIDFFATKYFSDRSAELTEMGLSYDNIYASIKLDMFI